MSNSKLIRWSGLSAILAGVLFILIQLIHPHEELSAVTTSMWAITHYLTIVMAIFGLLGITGIYVQQVKETGWPGLVGFLMFYVWLALTIAFTFMEAFILPLLVTEAPQFVTAVLDFSANADSFGALATIRSISGPFYIFGGALFGMATFRAGILPRWAGLLLTIGTVSALTVDLLPQGMGRFTVVPVSLGLIWLGYALWAEWSARTAVSITTATELG